MNTFFDDERVSAYLDGELAADERAAFERSLASQPELAALVDELRAVQRSLGALPRERLDGGFAARVLAQATAERDAGAGAERNGKSPLPLTTSDGSPSVQVAGRTSSPWRKLAWPLAAAAAVLLLLLQTPRRDEVDRMAASSPDEAKPAEPVAKTATEPSATWDDAKGPPAPFDAPTADLSDTELREKNSAGDRERKFDRLESFEEKAAWKKAKLDDRSLALDAAPVDAVRAKQPAAKSLPRGDVDAAKDSATPRSVARGGAQFRGLEDGAYSGQNAPSAPAGERESIASRARSEGVAESRPADRLANPRTATDGERMKNGDTAFGAKQLQGQVEPESIVVSVEITRTAAANNVFYKLLADNSIVLPDDLADHFAADSVGAHRKRGDTGLGRDVALGKKVAGGDAAGGETALAEKSAAAKVLAEKEKPQSKAAAAADERLDKHPATALGSLADRRSLARTQLVDVNADQAQVAALLADMQQRPGEFTGLELFRVPASAGALLGGLGGSAVAPADNAGANPSAAPRSSAGDAPAKPSASRPTADRPTDDKTVEKKPAAPLAAAVPPPAPSEAPAAAPPRRSAAAPAHDFAEQAPSAQARIVPRLEEERRFQFAPRQQAGDKTAPAPAEKQAAQRAREPVRVLFLVRIVDPPVAGAGQGPSAGQGLAPAAPVAEPAPTTKPAPADKP